MLDVVGRLSRVLDNEFSYHLIATLLNIALVIAGVSLHATWGQWLRFSVSAVLMLGVAVFDIILKRAYGRRKAFRVYEKLINGLLEVAAVSMLRAAKPPTNHIRINLMLPDKKGRLTIRYSWGFSDADMDLHVRIPTGTGCAGQAWIQESAMVADPTELSSGLVQWGLPKAEIDKIRKSLKSIFSVPIFCGNELFAILNFDSDNTIDQMAFRDEEVQLIGFSFASTLAAIFAEAK